MVAELALGSTQFGCDYGISNPRGRVAEDEVCRILSLAAQSGVRYIDTSPHEGDVERLLGRSWPFPSPFKPQVRTLRLEKGLDWVESRARRSVEHMGLARAHAVMIDAAEDLTGPQGDALWARLQKLKSDGLFSKIGISAHYSDAPLLLARRFKPDMIQVPVSLLDQRLVRNGDIEAIADLGIEVQARSVFLQGLIFLPREDLPPNLQALGPQLSRMRRAIMEAGTDPLHAALSYVLHLKGVTSAVVGVTSEAELRVVLAAAERQPPRLNMSALAVEDEILLDPRLWFADLPQVAARRLAVVA